MALVRFRCRGSNHFFNSFEKSIDITDWNEFFADQGHHIRRDSAIIQAEKYPADVYSCRKIPVDGTTGGGRMAAILVYSYFLWIVGNVCYWVGWLEKTPGKVRIYLGKFCDRCQKYIFPYCAIVGICLAAIIYKTDLRDLSSYKAYRDWRQGWAQQYAAEWEARLEILHDDTIKEVIFEPLSVAPEMLMYTDLQDEDGYIWVNGACAEYYEKESVRILVTTE